MPAQNLGRKYTFIGNKEGHKLVKSATPPKLPFLVLDSHLNS